MEFCPAQAKCTFSHSFTHSLKSLTSCDLYQSSQSSEVFSSTRGGEDLGTGRCEEMEKLFTQPSADSTLVYVAPQGNTCSSMLLLHTFTRHVFPTWYNME